MTAVWPATLNDRWLAGSWSEEERPHYDADVTDSGREVRSKMPGSPLCDVVGAMHVDTGGKADLKAFYKTTCARGSLPFLMRDPDEGVLRVFWWTSPPRFSETEPPSPGLYRVTIALAREE